jgi:hypothetical protein
VKIEILQGYFPGTVGEITAAHAVYYRTHWGYDVRFETRFEINLNQGKEKQ